MEEETTVLYGVLNTLTKDGLVRVGRQECFEVDFEKGLYWPASPGAGDCLIGNMRSTVPEALEQEAKNLKGQLKTIQKAMRNLEKKLEAVQAGRANPSNVHLSKKSPYDSYDDE